jgi:molybdopterin-guanine dinucleotide biosynthesis adapter protein
MCGTGGREKSAFWPIDPQLRSFFNVNKRRDWEQMQHILDPGSMVSYASDPIEKEKYMNRMPVISVVGKSNVGKTTLLEKLLPELKRRGYRVATIKHDAHHFELDTPGKDTWRHAQAGSDCVVISSAEKLAMIQKVEEELTLDDIVAQLPAVDIVLTEGYKRQDKPKIEVSRREMGSQLLCTRDELICLATDQPFDLDVPQFDINDAVGIVDLVEKRFLQKK